MIWKLLSSLVLNLILIMCLPYLLSSQGYLFDIKEKSWLILGICYITISIKTVFGDIASGDFMYHKHGYDFCVACLGATMTALSLQILSDENLFPSFVELYSADSLNFTLSEARDVTLYYLWGIMVFASFFTALTARISRAVTKESPKYPDLLSIINFLLGSLLMSCYILILIAKG